MIGSISKVKPAGRKCYLKYSSSKTVDDMKTVEPNYKQDIDNNGLWNFNLDSLTDATSLHLSNSYITETILILPKATNIVNLLRGCSSLCKAKVDAPLATNASQLIYGDIRLTDFEMDTKNITYFAYFGEGASLKKLNFAMGKISNAGNAFMGNYGGRHTATVFESALPSLIQGTRMLNGGTSLLEAKYPVDKNGNCIWDSGLEQLILNGEPQFKYLTLPKLSNGSEMFTNARFNKETTLSILNSLPSYDSGSHPFGFSCDTDLVGDPDINLALKKVDTNYVELTDLSETVTSGKGWTLTHKWIGNATENELMTKEVRDRLELNSVSLPSGYKRCLYLQDNGTAWIDTNYTPTNTTGVWLIAKQLKHNHWGIPIGVGGSLYRPPVWFNGVDHGACHSYWNGQTAGAWGYIGKGEMYEGQLNFLNCRNTTVRLRKVDKTSSSTSTTLPTLTQSSTKPMYMFADNNNGVKNQWNGRIYRVKISEGTSIVRDFIPCLDASGKPCMRDVINGVNYYNQGTSDFTYELYNG